MRGRPSSLGFPLAVWRNHLKMLTSSAMALELGWGDPGDLLVQPLCSAHGKMRVYPLWTRRLISKFPQPRAAFTAVGGSGELSFPKLAHFFCSEVVSAYQGFGNESGDRAAPIRQPHNMRKEGSSNNTDGPGPNSLHRHLFFDTHSVFTKICQHLKVKKILHVHMQSRPHQVLEFWLLETTGWCGAGHF